MKSQLPRRQFLQAASLAVTGGIAADLQGAEAGREAAPPPGAIREAPRDVPVVHECDVCVVGGSCTGVFAAVAAARLGAKVALVELNGFFGGVATASLVSIWHSLDDLGGKQPIIGGLTKEIIERLRKRGAVSGQRQFVLNTEMLKLELDRLVTEAKIRPFLHAMFVAPASEEGRMTAAIFEDKSGRRAIRARQFVDATGDADLVHRLGLPVYRREHVQPPTMCCVLRGLEALGKEHPGFNVHSVIFDPQYPEAIRRGFAWSARVPGEADHTMLAGTRVFGADCSDADQLTRAEIEGRRQVASVCDLLREHFMDGEGVPLGWLPAKIGIRETRHARCLHTLTTEELLGGKRFPDAIGNGTYPVDIHSADGAGVTFRHLKGVPFYQIPFSSLVPQGARNVLIAGRSVDADEGAFGAVRVMVNCNQMGQAAGVAAWLALDCGADVARLDAARLRAKLAEQGAIVL